MSVNYRWATYGVGVIGHQLAEAMEQLGGSLYSVGNRTHEKAESFAKQYGIEKVYDDPDEMFSDPDVDIIYISTPHNTHIDLLRKALSAGKHVLCEKAITLNSEELTEAIALAEKNHVSNGISGNGKTNLLFYHHTGSASCFVYPIASAVESPLCSGRNALCSANHRSNHDDHIIDPDPSGDYKKGSSQRQ